MYKSVIFLAFILTALSGFWLVYKQALKHKQLLKGPRSFSPYGLPRHFGYFAGLQSLWPGLCLYGLWLFFGPMIVEYFSLKELEKLRPDQDIEALLNQLRLALSTLQNTETPSLIADEPYIFESAARAIHLLDRGNIIFAGLGLLLNITGLVRHYHRALLSFPVRQKLESLWQRFFLASSILAVFITLAIIFSLFYESLRFFEQVSPLDFLFGTHWSPQSALRASQAGSNGQFGLLPLLSGSLLVALIALAIAGPFGLLSAIFLSQYAPNWLRLSAKPPLELLAGIPTVVYGFFAASVVGPILQNIGHIFGLSIAGESALGAGLVMGAMITPYISSLTQEALSRVPKDLKNGSLALGATHFETIRHIILPHAWPAISSAFLLAASRAIGETMIVVMALGSRPNLHFNPFEQTTTVTAQIVILLTGDQEFNSPKTLAAFALGLTLFALTLLANITAHHFMSLRVNAQNKITISPQNKEGYIL